MKDNREILICPACGKDMEKVKMHDEGLFLDVCLNGCGGIYFDNRELEKFDEKTENIDDLTAAYKGRTFETAEDRDRVCPSCGNNFVKHFVGVEMDVKIDDCYSCGGKFFDFCELEKMREQYNSTKERINDVVNHMYSSDSGSEIREQLGKPRKKALLYDFFCNLFGGLG